MITKVSDDTLIFVTNEDIEFQEFVAKLRLDIEAKFKNDLKKLVDDEMFLRILDKKLSHIYTIFQLYIDKKYDSIKRIEETQQLVYNQTWAELCRAYPEAGDVDIDSVLSDDGVKN